MHIPLIKKGNNLLINLISQEQWEDAAIRVKYFPKEAKKEAKVPTTTTSSKVLPLHHACAHKPTLEVTEALLRSYPSAAKKRDSLFKRLPLHVACLNGASADIIRELLVVYRDGASDTLKDGSIALHYACGSGASKEVIEELVRVYPNGVKVQDKNGWLPVHLACLQNASKEVIQILLDVYPESVSMRTNKGNTPLQCFRSTRIANADSIEVLSLLRKTEALLRRTMPRCYSTSRIDELRREENLLTGLMEKRRCSTAIFVNNVL